MLIQVFFGGYFYKLLGSKVFNFLIDEFSGWEVYVFVRFYFQKRVLIVSYDKIEYKYQDVMVEVSGQD